MQLIYLSPVPWTSFAQRPHKFVEWFHKTTGGHVLWVDPYPTRFPSLSDFRRLGQQVSQENDSCTTWLKVIRPSALPIEPLPWSGWVNALIWKNVLDEVVAFAHQQPTLLGIGKPSVFALAVMSRLGGAVSVYDAMDDFPSFYTGLSRMAMRRRELELISRSTHVLVSSTALQRRWSKLRSDVQLVLNGLDASVLPVKKDRTSSKTEKVLGYVGTIGPWFDWDWVINLARVRPLDEVRLIGPMFTPPPYVLPTNIRIHPPCTHQEALYAMQEFDIGLIPFKRNNLTASVDPIKYYEYRALGLPIISTNFGEMAFRRNENGTFLSHRIDDISGVVQAALLYNLDIQSVNQFVPLNTWDERFSNANII
jgi:glycosyltransferase involved in cell wall biosynthesis